MTYTTTNFKTKNELKKALRRGDRITVEGDIGEDGTAYIVGPHSPHPQVWQVAATVADGVIVKILSARGARGAREVIATPIKRP